MLAAILGTCVSFQKFFTHLCCASDVYRIELRCAVSALTSKSVDFILCAAIFGLCECDMMCGLCFIRYISSCKFKCNSFPVFTAGTSNRYTT